MSAEQTQTTVQELQESAALLRTLAGQQIEIANRLEVMAHQQEFKAMVAKIVASVTSEQRSMITLNAMLHFGSKRWDTLGALELVSWKDGWTKLGLAVREVLRDL
jgi:hypothetical protein